MAALSPRSVALRSGGREVTYADLDAMSTRWAARLSRRGVGRGTLVPVLLPRSVDLVIALLAVLKTGAAFALLDRQWPGPHLRAVVDDLRAVVVIDGDAPIDVGVPVWTPPAEPARDSHDLPGGAGVPDFRPAEVSADEACCVFFTSGTTGRPKGVVVPHRAISRLFVDDTFARFDQRTVITLAAATPWDAFALELWGGLLRGGTSVVVEEPFLTPDLLRQVITTDGVNTVWLTSSVFNMIVDEDLQAFAGLEQVMVGGERLSVCHVRRFLETHPTVELTNGYGPVESTVFASTHRVTPMDHLRPGGIPLGVCVPATRICVLNGDRECGDDEEGEICISGDGLAIGYLGDPELTAERFGTYILDGRPTRVYRTGDLGMWRSPDGLLEFRGRADRQIKVRGNRVEPADIEQAILNLSPLVAGCHIVARRTVVGDTYELVAFCVPREKGDPLSGLLGLIGSHLPAYQCPARVVVVDDFPLNDRGKISEARLLERLPARTPVLWPSAESADRPPVGDLAEMVAGGFAEVLGRTAVPRDVSFFAQGGSSLDAARLCARIGQAAGTVVPLSQFYRNSDVDRLAAWLRGVIDEKAPEPEAEGECDLSPVQTTFLLRDVVQPDGLTNHCLLAWTLTGQADLEALDRAVVAVHERHEALRAAYKLEPRPHSVTTDIDAPALHVLRPTCSVESALNALKAELTLPFAPEEGFVWRAAVAPVTPGEVSIFGCSVHHVAFDGWSEAVLADDLSRAYNGEVEAPAPPSLAQLGRQRRRQLDRGDVEGQLSALAEMLRDVPTTVWPRTGRPMAAAGVGVIGERLSPSDYAAVARLARARATTAFTVLLTAWGAAVAEVLGTTDTVVGVPVANRGLAGDELALGCHLAVVPIRLRGPSVYPGPAVTFADAVDGASRRVEEALACQDVPVARLVEVLGPAPRGRPPIFQMMFALQDNRTANLRLNGLSVSRLRLPYPDVPMELHCELWPAEDASLLAEVSYQAGVVPVDVAQALLSVFAHRIRTIES
ncbi:AMP-binding protein [Dactylosporangium roseum]|uniref:AMP-binding protein n=1 Tax=Dactylosporangium roseum TaxID=47989 RepID=A0ABY5ZF92_9ACTN|nr:AMP-binding protein [Dactylosporangium roseum]UWZ39333.1 AMP-binding protein [Dactylosporangium roseum]